MKYRAVLTTTTPQERVVQTFHPTQAKAEEWAMQILARGGSLPDDYVDVYETREERIARIRPSGQVADLKEARVRQITLRPSTPAA